MIAIIGITYLLFTEKKANRELVQEFQLDKEDLENEYSQFVQKYDELKFTVTNDSLALLLEQEQLKTQRLLEELRTVKSSNATEIRRLKKELATLRKILVGYVNQIDSLDRINKRQATGDCRRYAEIQHCFTANQYTFQRKGESG